MQDDAFIDVIEPFFVPDIFAHRLARTEMVGQDLFRFVFTVEQTCSTSGDVEHVVVCKLVVPKDNAMANQRAASRRMGMKATDYMAR